MLNLLDRRVPTAARDRALAYLNRDEQTLFNRLHPSDQRHTLAVHAAAMTTWPNDGVLHVAALLHDVGKGRPSTLHRIVFTLLATFAPWILLRWENQPITTNRGQIARLSHDTESSARFAQLANSSPDVIDTLHSYGFRDHTRGHRLAELDAIR